MHLFRNLVLSLAFAISLAERGYSEGLELVKDINLSLGTSGTAAGSPGGFVELNGKSIFIANDGVHGREPWVSDGTEAGTQMLKDVFVGASGSMPQITGYSLGEYKFLIKAGANAYFLADDGNGVRLWATDGTTAGTRRVSATAALPTFAWTEFNGQLYYFASSVSQGVQLWRSNGTATGTNLILQTAPYPYDWLPNFLGKTAQYLFLSPDEGGSGAKLRRTNGEMTGAPLIGSYLINAIFTENEVAYQWPGQFKSTNSVNDKLIFSVNSNQLWASNGSGSGTSMLKDFSTSYPDKTISQLLPIGSGQLLVSLTEQDPEEFNRTFTLWKTNGTASGTVLVHAPISLPPSSVEPRLREYDGKAVFFVPSENSANVTMWISNGTQSGTLPVTEVPGYDNDLNFEVDGLLYFSCGQDLCVTDGTTSGTSVVVTGISSSLVRDAGFTVIGKKVLFSANSTEYGQELFSLDLSGGIDLCPNDSAKLEPGQCGCGMADVDLNANQVVDCHDVPLPTVPAKAKLSLRGKKLKITMPAFGPGVRYEVKVTQLVTSRVRVNGKWKVVRVQKTTSKTTSSKTLTVTVNPKFGGSVVYSIKRGQGTQLFEQSLASRKSNFKV